MWPTLETRAAVFQGIAHPNPQPRGLLPLLPFKKQLAAQDVHVVAVTTGAAAAAVVGRRVVFELDITAQLRTQRVGEESI